MHCYNCRAVGNHLSQDCPIGQQYKRCPSCKVVAKTTSSHKDTCRNKQFISTFIGCTSTVFSLRDALIVEFKGIEDEYFVMDGQRPVPIGKNQLWLSAIDSFISKSGANTLNISTSRSTKKSIVILDKDEKPTVSIVFDFDTIVVNSRYILRSNGVVSFNYKAENHVEQPHVCKLKVLNTSQMFKMRLSLSNNTVYAMFDVYVNYGAILIDNQIFAAKRSLDGTMNIDAGTMNIDADNSLQNDGTRKDETIGDDDTISATVEDENKTKSSNQT